MSRVVNLPIITELEIEPKRPFNFDGTVYVPQHFPTPDFEWKKGIYWQTMNFQGTYFGIKMVNAGTSKKPKIRLSLYSQGRLRKEEVSDIIRELNWRYGLDEDIAGFCTKFKSDKFLRSAMKRLYGTRISCANSLYELLIISITLQNATVRRTVQMMNNLLNGYGTRLKFDKKELFAYWNPEDMNLVKEDELRLLKVGYRAKMIKRISEGFSKKDVNESNVRELGTDNAKDELMKLYGVGPATAQIIVGEYLRRYDIFDLKGKVWEQKILSRILFNKELVGAEKILSLMKDRYGEWQGLAFHYMFTDLFWRHLEKKIDWLEKEIRM